MIHKILAIFALSMVMNIAYAVIPKVIVKPYAPATSSSEPAVVGTNVVWKLTLEGLPHDIKTLIVPHLANKRSFEEAITAIKTLYKNKTFYPVITKPAIFMGLVSDLENNFCVDIETIIKALIEARVFVPKSVQPLLRAKIKKEQDFKGWVTWAIAEDVRPKMRELMEEGVNAKAAGLTGVINRIRSATPASAEFVNAVTLLFEEGLNANCENFGALLITQASRAVQGAPALPNDPVNHDLEILRLLLAHGADVNYVNPYTGDTPLISAAEAGRGHADELTLHTLLYAGANKNARNMNGRTAYDYARNNRDLSPELLRDLEPD